MATSSVSEVVQAEGHLIDSQLLNAIFDKVIERNGKFEVLHFDIGRTNDEFSKLTLKVSVENESALGDLLEELMPLGGYAKPESDLKITPAEADACVPDDFYSTTNHRTYVKYEGMWIEVESQRMDAVIVVADGRASCKKLRDVRRGDRIVCGVSGIKISPEFRERDRLGFAFRSVSRSSTSRSARSA